MAVEVRTPAQLADAYVLELSVLGHSPRTIATYHPWLRLFTAFLGERTPDRSLIVEFFGSGHHIVNRENGIGERDGRTSKPLSLSRDTQRRGSR